MPISHIAKQHNHSTTVPNQLMVRHGRSRLPPSFPKRQSYQEWTPYMFEKNWKEA